MSEKINKWTDPTIVLSVIGMATASLVFIVAALFKVHDNFSIIYQVLAKYEERFMNYETSIKGMDDDINVLFSNDLSMFEHMSNIQQNVSENTKAIATVHLMAKENQNLINVRGK